MGNNVPITTKTEWHTTIYAGGYTITGGNAISIEKPFPNTAKKYVVQSIVGDPNPQAVTDPSAQAEKTSYIPDQQAILDLKDENLENAIVEIKNEKIDTTVHVNTNTNEVHFHSSDPSPALGTSRYVNTASVTGANNQIVFHGNDHDAVRIGPGATGNTIWQGKGDDVVHVNMNDKKAEKNYFVGGDGKDVLVLEGLEGIDRKNLKITFDKEGRFSILNRTNTANPGIFEGYEFIRIDGKDVAVADLKEILALPPADTTKDPQKGVQEPISTTQVTTLQSSLPKDTITDADRKKFHLEHLVKLRADLVAKGITYNTAVSQAELGEFSKVTVGTATPTAPSLANDGR